MTTELHGKYRNMRSMENQLNLTHDNDVNLHIIQRWNYCSIWKYFAIIIHRLLTFFKKLFEFDITYFEIARNGNLRFIFHCWNLWYKRQEHIQQTQLRTMRVKIIPTQISAKNCSYFGSVSEVSTSSKSEVLIMKE